MARVIPSDPTPIRLDGRAARSCLLPAGDAVEKSITTIDGLEKDGQLHPVQEAFPWKPGFPVRVLLGLLCKLREGQQRFLKSKRCC
jgi:hypothetical protein